ncbi:MAG: hypothetical protein ACRD28_10005 [Acidobacteriaceae bacterium]
MTGPSTLPSLLWEALRTLDEEHSRQGAGTLYIPSLELWSNLLRAINQTGIDRRELPAILRLSKRAVRSRVSTATRHGWVELSSVGSRHEVVRLTPRGASAVARWTILRRTVEDCWKAAVGIKRSVSLRTSLEELVAALPLELPHYPASYGAADASITGGHGKDWKAVPRAGGDTTSDLPISALVSQALVAFAMEYEEQSPVALSLSTQVIRRIPAEGQPLHVIGQSPGVAALIRHGFMRVSNRGGSKVAFLTLRGLDVQRAYEPRIYGIETAWRQKFGDSLITELRRSLER